MASIRSGVDILEIERMEGMIHRHAGRFLQRIYTPKELAQVGDNPASLAVRFAAKEAISKALGCGIGMVGWKDIEILYGPNNQPQIHLYGPAKVLSRQLGLDEWSVSLSHSQELAIAFVVALSS